MEAEDVELEEQSEVVQPIKRVLTLRRSTVVKKNLQTLKDNQQKKQIAQASFYEGTENVSPLLRVEEEKAPVHERLGATEPQQPQKRRLILRRNFSQKEGGQQRMRNQGQRSNFRNNNNNRMYNGTRRRQFIPPNGIITKKYRHNAQQRLMLIRKSFQNYGNLSTNNKKILRRPRPVNYQIRIPNTGPIRHSVKGSINPQIQEEIALLREDTPAILDPIPNVALPITANTRVTMHERFSSLP